VTNAYTAWIPNSWRDPVRWRFVRTVGRALARLARSLTAPIVRAFGRVARPMRDRSHRIVSSEVEVVEAEPELGERLDAAILARLQLGPRSKLLDLRAARLVKVALFERLASAWQAPRGTVARLGVLLDYERWIILRNVAARRLHPIVDRGVDVGIFYAQQADSLDGWFSRGEACRDRLRDVIHWLRTKWRSSAVWPSVLSRTASLVQESGETDAVPEMLLELAAIARSFPGSEGAEQAAKHAGAALAWIGDQPSRVRCRALRATATATLALGQTEAGVALLETAFNTATVLGDPIEQASALAEIGFHLLRRGYHARAETRLRVALALLSDDDPAYLRATLHHDLALALVEQGREPDEAELHVTAALNLRESPSSQLASEDIALIARIRAQRASPPSQPTPS